MPLTDTQIRSLRASEKRFRCSDGGGLFIEVLPSGKKVFRLAYRVAGNQRTKMIGDYPRTSLADARLKASAFKLDLNSNDPDIVEHATRPRKTTKVRKRETTTWEQVANGYLLMRQQSNPAPRTLAKLNRQIGVTIDALGTNLVYEITPEDVLDVVNPIAATGRVETAHEIRTRFSQVFRYAAARGLVTHDPAAFTIDAMVQRRRGEFAGITNPKEVGELMVAIGTYRETNPIVGTALLLSAYLFPRNTELRGMRWEEIDWDGARWDIPGKRMKMNRDHIVPLPAQAIELLRQLQQYDFGSQLVLPSPRDPMRMVSEMTFNAALRRMGYNSDRHVHHGFRTSASTNLNEMGWNYDWIERQLAHVPANKVRSSYNKAHYLDGRTKMMQAYADWLDVRCADACNENLAKSES
ncbi:tyrosine-type recombinase/integrase [Yoonia sp. SDW83-1]|uniref:tyrosine-type recombinase/integrase n=1 Tax=Yoonia sp. SDW83-1 TaxID=3366945 RepID=UPI00398C7701